MSTSETNSLKLQVSDATEVDETQISHILPAVDEEQEERLSKEAQLITKSALSVNTHSPDFVDKLAQIRNLGQSEINYSGASFSRLLGHSRTSTVGSKQSGDNSSQHVSKTLSELRGVISGLTPDGGLTGYRKILGFIPMGRKVDQFFQRYDTAETHLEEIVTSLMVGQDDLMKDNAGLQQEKRELWDNMNRLNEYVVLAEKMDEELTQEVETLRQNGDIVTANAVETDLLFPVRQRRQDLLAQLTVSLQGYMLMELTRKNNEELIRGVDRARTTTIYALKVAVAVSSALSNQKAVIDGIDAVNDATNSSIEHASQAMREQTLSIQRQATSSGVSVESLEKAFNNLFQTLDDIDTFRKDANSIMDSNITNLTDQLKRVQPNLNRFEAVQEATKKNYLELPKAGDQTD